MPKFIYVGVATSGNQVRGEITADSKAEVISLLRKKKIRPITVGNKPIQISFTIGSGVKMQDVGRFTRQFSAMTSAGLPLVQCLDILAEQTENKILGKTIRQVSMDIQGGATLADSMKKHPAIFNTLYCNMVAAGESSGSLDTVLRRLAEYQEAADTLSRKIRGAMAYPTIVAIVAVGVTIIMLTFVVPTFAAMFTDMGGSLPLPTQIVMTLSALVRKYLLYAVGAVIVGLIIFQNYYKTDHGKLVVDSAKLNIPILGDLLRKSAVSRFSQTLATLLASGISIIEALNITAKTAGNRLIEKGLMRTLERISGGLTIAEPLKETGVFPPMVIHMISVGEKTGDLPEMLVKISEFYTEEVDAAVQALTSVIEPIMIIIMAILVGGIMMAMYLPMFDIVNMVG